MTHRTIERIVAGSGLHTANGLAFAPDGRLLVASVVGRSIFALDLESRAVEVVVAPPQGVADDLIVTRSGELIWTALLDGAVRMRGTDGKVRDLALGLPGVNSIAMTRDGRRLFVGQVFMGEAVWEIDLDGRKPPRRVVDDTGGINACQFGPDGLLYGPSWLKGQVVRIDPDTGKSEVVCKGLKHPGAVRFDSRDRLHVLDDATGELFSVGRADGRKTLIATLASATDNFIFGRDDLAYVSNMADNSVHEVDTRSGAVREIVKGRLAFPVAIAIAPGDPEDLIHVADGCSYRTVDPRTGQVSDVARSVVSEIVFPTAVSANARHVILASDVMGTVQTVDRRRGLLLRTLEDFARPGAAIELENGDLIVAESVAGRLLTVRGSTRKPLVEGLDHPTGLLDAGDGHVFVAESGAARVLSVDVATGAGRVIASGCGAVRVVAAAPGGQLALLDAGGCRVLLLDPQSGECRVVAEGLAVGYLQVPHSQSGGLAVASDGSMYIAADVDNAIDRLRAGAQPAALAKVVQ